MSNYIDITGQKLGRLTVIERDDSVKQGASWKCKCDCGTYITVKGVDLRRGNIQSCGCYRHEFRHNDLAGKKFGKLTVIKRESLNAGHGSTWVCKCNCGNTVVVRRDGLTTGHTTSCGCYRDSGESRIRHGMTNTRLHRIWNAMKQRCSNPNFKQFKDYGGRGIRVCEEWLNDYKVFKEWAIANGYEEHLTIDRIDVNGNYEPDNCRWITLAEQENNRRDSVYLTYQGITKTASQWSKLLRIKPSAIYYLKRKQLSDDDIFRHFPQIAEVLAEMRGDKE